MTVRVQQADFDLGAELTALRAGDARVGALASFVGLVRDFSHGTGVAEMTLEHYPGMTEKSLADIVGLLLPGDRIVFVAVASSHRGDAFAACEFIMDYLKTKAPFWKREVTAEGARWVDARETDDSAAARWQTAEPQP